ncbi:SCO-spondin-like [Apteryx mantelli]|uniref:SCO-spondin-like n=1 Tax=Apteryx mantelli TaxID=2696672 RepID=A0ABM4FWA6_9AVES
MHYYGEQYKHLCLPGSGYSTENLQVCAPQADVCSATCHPLSVTKSPMPRWPGYLQPFALVCAQPSVAPLPLLRCQPYVQRCILLGPEPCKAACLVPCAEPSGQPGAVPSPQPCDAGRFEKKRVAKSLPPCAPKCPEPGKLRFPPCGIRYSSSCKNECKAQRGSKCCPPQAMPGRYSRPLQGGTECPPPPQQCALQECVPRECGGSGGGFPPQRCTKGYPTQECVTECLPQPCGAKCPPGQGAKGCPLPPQRLAKGSLPPDGAKQRCLATQHATKSRCSHHMSRHHAGKGKGSSHAKKSCCAAKWLC